MSVPEPHARILPHFAISEQGLRELEIWLLDRLGQGGGLQYHKFRQYGPHNIGDWLSVKTTTLSADTEAVRDFPGIFLYSTSDNPFGFGNIILKSDDVGQGKSAEVGLFAADFRGYLNGGFYIMYTQGGNYLSYAGGGQTVLYSTDGEFPYSGDIQLITSGTSDDSIAVLGSITLDTHNPSGGGDGNTQIFTGYLTGDMYVVNDSDYPVDLNLNAAQDQTTNLGLHLKNVYSGTVASLTGETIEVQSDGRSTLLGEETTVTVGDQSAASASRVHVTASGDANTLVAYEADVTALDSSSAFVINGVATGTGDTEVTGSQLGAAAVDGTAYGDNVGASTSGTGDAIAVYAQATVSGSGTPYAIHAAHGNNRFDLSSSGQTFIVNDHLGSPLVTYTG